METRGRNQNIEVIKQVHRYKEAGMPVNLISDIMDIKPSMVRYYLRQEVKEKPEKTDSLATCFYRQPKEVQVRIAREIGYRLPDMPEEPEIFVDPESLLGKCTRFLNGEIQPNEMDENFTADEMVALQALPKFMSKSKEIFAGIKSPYSMEEVLEEVKNVKK